MKMSVYFKEMRRVIVFFLQQSELIIGKNIGLILGAKSLKLHKIDCIINSRQ